MTEKLYLKNGYLFEFESTVESVNKTDNIYEVILQSTAFYPESGGQMYDLGLLDNQKIIAVYKDENDRVIHQVDNWTAPEGTSVKGIIDKERRLDNMRKHTGQHILSQAFARVADIFTISAHLGEPESTIELDTESIDEETLHRAEVLANEIVRDNVPVSTGFYSPEELKRLPVRKIPKGKKQYRIVSVGDFECTACAGTHVNSSGEIGLIKIIGYEKIRNHVRVIFLCGRNAFDDYCQKHKVIEKLSSRLTCHFLDFDEAVDKLQIYISDLKQEISSLNKELIPLEIEKLKEIAEIKNNIYLVTQIYERRETKDIINLGNALCKSIKAVAILSAENRIFVFVSEDMGIKASLIARKFTENNDGRGGGSDTFAQIGGISPEKLTYSLDKLVEIVKNELGR